MPHLIDTRLLAGSKRKSIAWWCPSGHRNSGGDRFCATCEHSLVERHAQVAPSERTVYYRNPQTGQIWRPPRTDSPIPEYVSQGYVREEVMSMIRHERETGSIHEASNFSPGNEVIPTEAPMPRAPKEVIQALVDDVRAAIQSGPFTMEQPLSDNPTDQ